MRLRLMTDNINAYLEATDIINFKYKLPCKITNLSKEIKTYSIDNIDYIKNAFEYVRDEISHSADIKGSIVNCKASDVLTAKEGICYAKAHLLAAILRCNNIPAGFCYQRLILCDETSPILVVHGLNAVFIEKISRWIRLDARGNKNGVNAQFSLEHEILAFPIRVENGEEDIPIIYDSPDENVIKALTENKTLEQLWANLPNDIYRPE